MYTTGYLAWINDEQYWHREFRAAQARVVLAQFSGKDTVLRGRRPADPPNRRVCLGAAMRRVPHA